jgi:hypothetical protein
MVLQVLVWGFSTLHHLNQSLGGRLQQAQWGVTFWIQTAMN